MQFAQTLQLVSIEYALLFFKSLQVSTEFVEMYCVFTESFKQTVSKWFDAKFKLFRNILQSTLEFET